MDTLNIKAPEWIDAIPITLSESVKAVKGKKYKFTATVLVWDPELEKEWSIISRNGVRYNRAKSIEQFKSTITQNKGIPVMYNHIIDDNDADQLGLITKVYDTEDGLVCEGILNGYKQRVLEEILPGFLNNVSLQVDGERETIDEEGKDIIYASPTDIYEVSFVPVNGVVGANNANLAIAESIKKANKALKEKIINKKKLMESLTEEDIEKQLDGIEEKFDMTPKRYSELYKEAMKEVYATNTSQDEVIVNMKDTQIAKGLAVEMEHEPTYNWLAQEIAKGNGLPPLETFARMIAEDHVNEDPQYYDNLMKLHEEQIVEPKGVIQNE